MSEPRPSPDDSPPTTDPDATRPPSVAPDPHATRPPSSFPDTRPPSDDPASSMGDLARPDRGGSMPSVPGFEDLEWLGEGGMGVVYKARQSGLNRTVALKMMLGSHHLGRAALTRFLAEAEAVASIRHPHVVQVYESGDAEGRPFLAMEFLPGDSLDARLKARGRFDPRAAAALVAKLARAVQAAHDQGIVHRDLKPANVLFDEAGEPKVTDFGLAKRATGTGLTMSQAIMGTPAYMAPEQARGATKFVGPQADIYALGVILYELLSGTRPFESTDTHLLLRSVVEDEPERPGRRVPGLPRDLELIVLECLAKDPADRYETARALADDLDRFLANEPVSVRAAGTFERALKWARRKPTLAAAYTLTVAVLVLAAFGASLAVLWRDAEGARATAVIERGKAVVARDAEKKARGEAEKARDEVSQARETLARNEYGRTMQVAHQEWRDNNIVAALALLEGTRPDLRGWEWRYVHHLCHGELLALKKHPYEVSSVCFSPDGSRILTVSRDVAAWVWDARTGAGLLALEGHTESVNLACFSPDGSRILTASRDRTARVWDARTGAGLLALEGHTGPVSSACFSPDGSRLVITTKDRAARVWDARTGAGLLALEGHTRVVSSACFSPDGSRILTASDDRTARVWDARTGAGLLALKGHTESVNSACFSPDGSRILTASRDRTARVWDARTGAGLLALEGHTGPVSSACFSPDGSRLVITTKDRAARVWDARTGAGLLALEGHTRVVSSACFSPDGSRILTAGGDKTARVWDARTGAELLALKGHTAWVNSACFSPDGSRILTTSYDKTARVWDSRPMSEVSPLVRAIR